MKEALDVILKAVTESRYLMKVAAFMHGKTVATDGRRLLAIDGQFAEPPSDKFPKIPAEWLEDKGEGVAYGAVAVVEAIGPMPEWDTCDECEGTGSVFRTCDYCDDFGHDCRCDNAECMAGIIKYERPLRVGAAFVNRNLLADVLDELKPTGTIRVHAPKKDGQVKFFGEGWILIVMPMHYAGGETPALKDLIEGATR